jgi:3-hydroxyacyl-CoA dehydrogenase/enoyl-CoA hydratase/3-hydroxybutyryl-CoA epimerase
VTTASLVREGDVGILLFDSPGESVNVVSTAFLGVVTELVEEASRDASISACVIAGGSPGEFLAGADLHEFMAMTDPAEGQAQAEKAQRLLLLIERGVKPWVAAIHGAALGSGLDAALACQYRIATDHPRTSLGFPETTLGVVPGGGATQRLPRLVGLDRALDLFLTGRRLPARQALEAGLVDAVLPPGGHVDGAARIARSLARGELRPRRTLDMRRRLLALPLVRRAVLARARRDVLKRTHGFYPAPISLLDCIDEGHREGFAAGLAREATLFGRLVVSSDAKNLIRLFDATTELKKGADSGLPQRVAVVGAGLMGEGIALASLAVAPVALSDVSTEHVSRAARRLHRSLGRGRRAGEISRLERDRRWFSLTASRGAPAVAGADLVLEAVFEDLQTKRRVLAECEAAMSPDAVFASNTSAIPIGEIAAKAVHPERVLGMHYFSPVHRMPLVEIVIARRTSDAAVARARAFAVAQGKTPVLVRDGPGFYTTRILGPFLEEAMRCLEEGADVETLDRALVDFGFLIGPAGLLDEVGIDVGAHVTRELAPLFDARGETSTGALRRLVDAGYLGKKNGRGFYRPKNGRRRAVNPDVYGILGGAPRREMPGRDLAERCVLQMVNEAVHCLGDGAIRSVRDGDVAAILGLGFPPFRGGPFRYVDALGASAVAARLSILAERHGTRFAPAPILAEHAKDDRRFVSA